MLLRAAIGLILLAALCSFVARAQDAPCVHYTVPVSVIDGSGNSVQDLSAANFRAEFRGKPAQIRSVSTDKSPRRVVVLLDASGSMEGEVSSSKWDAARMLATNIAAYPPPNSSIALLVFAEKVEEKVDFAAGPQAVIDKLKELDSKRVFRRKGLRQTALRDSVLEALKLLGRSNSGDVIYVITDGFDNFSRTSARDLERALHSAGVRLFGVLLLKTRLQFFDPLEAAEPKSFQEMVEATGGGVLVWASSPYFREENYHLSERERVGLAQQLQWLYRQMSNLYWLQVELPRPLDKMQEWTLRITNAPGVKNDQIRVAYPKKLLPCSTPTASR